MLYKQSPHSFTFTKPQIAKQYLLCPGTQGFVSSVYLFVKTDKTVHTDFQ